MIRTLTILLFTISIGLLNSCMTKEERLIIEHYEGTYSGIHVKTWCCDNLGHIAYDTSAAFLEVKKRSGGIKITGVEVFQKFELNDSTFSCESKDGQEWANGRFHANDSISIAVFLSPKLPNAHYYMVTKN